MSVDISILSSITNNIDGTVVVIGEGQIFVMQRPHLALSILQRQNIDPNSDWDDVWDASTGRMVRALATRASQTNYLADGVGNTRTGNLGNINTSIFAAWDHVHPIIALTPPSLPNCAVSGSGATFVSQTIPRQRATEETVEYTIQVTTSNTLAAAWMIITPPTIAGYTLVGLTNYTYDGSAANLAPYWGTHPSFVWAGGLIYLRPRAAGLSLTHNINLTYILN